jgi:hypothetical protein
MAALLLGWPAMRPHLVSADAPANGSLTESLAHPEPTNGESSRRVSWRYKIRSAH